MIYFSLSAWKKDTCHFLFEVIQGEDFQEKKKKKKKVER